jgi:hypothetical protein
LLKNYRIRSCVGSGKVTFFGVFNKKVTRTPADVTRINATVVNASTTVAHNFASLESVEFMMVVKSKIITIVANAKITKIAADKRKFTENLLFLLCNNKTRSNKSTAQIVYLAITKKIVKDISQEAGACSL